jgi:hypothetical protein
LLFETPAALPQQRLFGLDYLGDSGWLKTVRLEDCVPRRFRPAFLQRALFLTTTPGGNSP